MAARDERQGLPLNPPTRAPVNAELVTGFARAVGGLQGGVPSAWTDLDAVAQAFAAQIPRLTVARLAVFCRTQGLQLADVAGKVLADALSTEPALLELTPSEAAEEALPLIDSLWPRAAVVDTRSASIDTVTPEVKHPVLDRLKELGGQWARLRKLPVNAAKQPEMAERRQNVMTQIARAKAEGIKAGLPQQAMHRALEAAGDHWSWDVPPPARDYFLDEYGQGVTG